MEVALAGGGVKQIVMRSLAFAVVVTALFLLQGCQKEGEMEFYLPVNEYDVSSSASTVNVSLTASRDYDVVVPAQYGGWISVVAKSEHSLQLAVSENSGTSSRVGTVQISHNGEVLGSVSVGQAAGLVYAAPKNEKFVRMAYFPSYQKQDAASMPDDFLQCVDVAAFAFATIQDDYTLKLNSGSATLQNLVSRCHGLGIKVVLSFNGTWLDKRYVTMSKSTKLRQKFIASLMTIVNQYGVDGVDNDWEYPADDDGSKEGNLYLMRELSNIMHAPGKNMLLTMAISSGIYASSKYYRGVDDGVFGCVDWFGSMVYDDYSESVTGKHHSTYESLVTSYNYWVGKRGMPSYKFVGGIPAYGRPSGIAQSGNILTYSTIISKGGDPDADQATVTTSAHPSAFTIYYNGRPTVRKKVDFCKDNGCGGYFFWEAGQDLTDSRSLLRAASAEALK